MTNRKKYGPPGLITQQELMRQIHYDPASGVFTWAIRKPKVKLGSVAGKLRPNGYREIRVNLSSYFEHRLAWLYVHGVWPEHALDHINRNPSDNRISNLREATQTQNLRNIGPRSNSKTGIKGVSLHRISGKYRAVIRTDGPRLWLGLFDTVDEAAAAYKAAAEKYHGEFACHE